LCRAFSLVVLSMAALNHFMLPLSVVQGHADSLDV